ncbi:hypothetical protein LSM04_008973 [Trypanosoma melophagium]|uniref:uncharacterized protein n=1 Tax=Trypanosoma melophagium TaxID=715481 RepID=UPI00351A5C58|nr:hypothetical protein LSM04_008973 [Trypanosoma melophagium]
MNIILLAVQRAIFFNNTSREVMAEHQRDHLSNEGHSSTVNPMPLLAPIVQNYVERTIDVGPNERIVPGERVAPHVINGLMKDNAIAAGELGRPSVPMQETSLLVARQLPTGGWPSCRSVISTLSLSLDAMDGSLQLTEYAGEDPLDPVV